MKVTGSLRFRLTAVATLLVAVVLASTALGLSLLQRRQLLDTLDRSLGQRADTIAELVAEDPVSTRLGANDEDRFIQLVSEDGTVLDASSNLDRIPALPNPLTKGGAVEAVETRADLPLEDDTYRVLTRRIDTAVGGAVLHVGENTDDLNDAIRLLATALAVALPLIVSFFAVLIWWLTGRALLPVEAIRAEVDSIDDADVRSRIPITDRNDEIDRLATTMNRMLDRLHDAAERQRRFTADAAHELRTPLTRIRTTVEVDLARPDEADFEATHRTVRDDTVRLQNLIDDLLHLARGDAGHRIGPTTAVDLDDIVMAEIRDLRASQPSVVVDATGVGAANLTANSEQLARAVRNLLANAAHHAQSKVVVGLTESGDNITLSIDDDGPGVPAAKRDVIFERFARLDESRRRSDGGTGLGLAITRDIVEAHGGSVRCLAAPGGGARFVVALPGPAARG